jgi:hypothetical protein
MCSEKRRSANRHADKTETWVLSLRVQTSSLRMKTLMRTTITSSMLKSRRLVKKSAIGKSTKKKHVELGWTISGLNTNG